MQIDATRRALVALVSALTLLAGAPLTVRADDPPPALVADPAALDFGIVEPNKLFRGAVKVTNVSEATVTISHMTLTVDYRLDMWIEGSCRSTVEPGKACGFTIYGVASVPDRYTSVIRIISDDPKSPLVIHVRVELPEPPDTGAPVMRQPPWDQEMVRAWKKPAQKARFLWSWWATDDKEVTGFQTQIRSGAAPWETVVKRSAPVRIGGSQKLPITVPTGREVRLRTRAFDAAGKASAWASSRRTVTYRDIRAGSPGLRGTWKTLRARGAYGGDVVVTERRGATASITVTARSISLLGRTSPKGGWITYEFGEDPWRTSLRSATVRDLVVLQTWTWPDVAKRTVTVTTDLQKPWQTRVALDSWVVIR